MILSALWYSLIGKNPNDAPTIDTSIEQSPNDYTLTETVTNIFKAWTPPAKAAPYLAAIYASEAKYNLPKNLLARLIYQESRFNPLAVSPVGALGIAQFMPATAKQFGIDPRNWQQSIDAAGKYLSQLFARFGRWDLALASYNWGAGNVSKYGLDRAPVETKNYYSQILSDVQVA